MVIVVINNKGGTGKTTTCVNLSAALANLGYRVLLVDLDPQASASLSLGVDYSNLSPSSGEVLLEGYSIEKAIRKTNINCLDLLTGGIELAHSDLVLSDIEDRENKLTEVLEPIKDRYDYILCDCAPALSLLQVNALIAGDHFIVPVVPEYLALEGLVNLMDVVERFKTGMGVDIDLLGIIINKLNSTPFVFLNLELRNQLDIVNLLREHYGDKVLKTTIKRNVQLMEAPSYNQSIFQYAPKSNAAQQYSQLAEEILMRCNGFNGSNQGLNQMM